MGRRRRTRPRRRRQGCRGKRRTGSGRRRCTRSTRDRIASGSSGCGRACSPGTWRGTWSGTRGNCWRCWSCAGRGTRTGTRSWRSSFWPAPTGPILRWPRGIRQPVCRAVHVAQQRRVGQQNPQRRFQKVAGGLHGNASRGQQPADDLRQLHPLRDAQTDPVLSRPPDPAPPAQAAADSQRRRFDCRPARE